MYTKESFFCCSSHLSNIEKTTILNFQTSIMNELKNFSENFLYEATVRYPGVFSYCITSLGSQILALLGEQNIKKTFKKTK